jgi:ribonuclease P protein component
MERLKKRRDFLKVQKGRRANTGLFSVQCLVRDSGLPRIGFTVSKKVYASAVKRNRIRRRLKEATRHEAAAFCATAADFVVVARKDVLTASFARIRSDLVSAMMKVSGATGGGKT